MTARLLAGSRSGPAALALTETEVHESYLITALRVKPPGDYERPGEIVECTPLGYALLFGGASERRTVTLLREHGAAE